MPKKEGYGAPRVHEVYKSQAPFLPSGEPEKLDLSTQGESTDSESGNLAKFGRGLKGQKSDRTKSGKTTATFQSTDAELRAPNRPGRPRG